MQNLSTDCKEDADQWKMPLFSCFNSKSLHNMVVEMSTRVDPHSNALFFCSPYGPQDSHCGSFQVLRSILTDLGGFVCIYLDNAFRPRMETVAQFPIPVSEILG
jgi:hypothetical protein